MTTATHAPTTESDGDAVPSVDEPSSNPRWAKPGLIALLVATAAFWTINLSSNGWGNSFYAAAVQAGTQSWKAFLFGSSDAGNSITVDKPPASLWVMEISARLFGFNSWSIQLPQVLLGLAAVALLYAAVRRTFGPAAGLLAGAVLALTPVATLMFRYDNPDALLVFLMVAAAWAVLRGIESGRTRWIVLCGALIGFGFLTKQLQVLLVMPGMGLAYLVAAQPRLRTRLLQLLAGLASAVVAAGWWVALVEFWPKDDRPYIGGSSNNSFLQLTLGYNGLGRILGGGSSGGLPSLPGGGDSGFHGPPMFGHAGITRMFTTESGTQISWLLPAALVLLVAGMVLCGRAARTDMKRASYIVWGGWLLSTGLVFSFMSGLFHDYYTVALAPGVAGVVGIGVVHLWRHREKLWVTLALGLALALTATWAWVLLGKTPEFVPALRWIIVAAGVLAVIGLIIPAVLPVTSPRHRDIRVWAAAVGIAAAIAGPAAYCVQTVSTSHSGPIITAGPSSSCNGMPGFPSEPPAGFGGDKAPSGMPPGEQKASQQVVDLLTVDADDYTWVAAANGSMGASNYQLASGESVMPIGGFGGGDPAPTLEQFQGYVANGRIHYYIESSHPGMPGPGGQSDSKSEGDRIGDWVKAHYTATSVDGVTLYDLTAAAH